MEVYNYAAFARAFAKGMTDFNRTKEARVLFKAIFSVIDVKNKKGESYMSALDNQMASKWYNQTALIPKSIQKAAGEPVVKDSIGEYFLKNILENQVINKAKESVLYNDLLALIKDSDLDNTRKDELVNLYKDQEYPEFLGIAFLYAVVGNNKKKSSIRKKSVDDSLAKSHSEFHQLIHCISEKYRNEKPQAITPKEIQKEELPYITALLRVYDEKTGKLHTSPEDLKDEPRYLRNFRRQRKYYWDAEAVRMSLRDTITPNKKQNFEFLKNEVYDGVSDLAEDGDFDDSYARMVAVISLASSLSLSPEVENITLGWIGPSEKKGTCHMLVNDKRLSWMGD